MLGLQPACFLGAIGAYAAGDTLGVFDTIATCARFDGNGIDVILGSGAVLRLDTTTPDVGVLSVSAGAHGDSLIRFAPAQGFGSALHASTGLTNAAEWLPTGHYV